MKCHEVDYEIFGDDMQIVEVELDPGETVIAEAGAMSYMEEGIDFEARMGDGSEPKQRMFEKLLSAVGRKLTGESIFMTHFTNTGKGKRRVAFAAPFPSNAQRARERVAAELAVLATGRPHHPTRALSGWQRPGRRFRARQHKGRVSQPPIVFNG